MRPPTEAALLVGSGYENLTAFALESQQITFPFLLGALLSDQVHGRRTRGAGKVANLPLEVIFLIATAHAVSRWLTQYPGRNRGGV